ncbi:sensor histidine kinase [Streptomyces sp. NBC_00158]|uniref:sensor histidine kinase n=1 Tax=Streptomyces sp. NBC_00158 TaxID=2903627 RepID=UPI003247DABC
MDRTTRKARLGAATDIGSGAGGTALAWAGAAGHLAVAGLLVGVARYTAPGVLAGVLLLAAGLSAGLLRRRPLTALALTLLAGSAVTFSAGGYGSQRLLVYLPAALLLGFVVATRPRRTAVAAGVLCAAVELPAVGLLAPGTDVLAAGLIAALTLVLAWLAGLTLSQRREHAVELRGREVAEAVTAERLRIARELHDMVAHSIGVIAIQAGVGSRVIDTQPEEARGALTAIEATSRETLAGLRRTLVALRRSEPRDDGDDRDDEGAAPTAPAPGLADLDALAASPAGAGVRVDVRRTGEPRRLPPEIELSAYRIVQEALTNVVRHAGAGAGARVTLDFRECELAVEVVDDGRGAAARPGRTGFGITGMYERVALLGGRFSAGPRPEGGFRVAAELPLPVTAAAEAAR